MGELERAARKRLTLLHEAFYKYDSPIARLPRVFAERERREETARNDAFPYPFHAELLNLLTFAPRSSNPHSLAVSVNPSGKFFLDHVYLEKEASLVELAPDNYRAQPKHIAELADSLLFYDVTNPASLIAKLPNTARTAHTLITRALA